MCVNQVKSSRAVLMQQIYFISEYIGGSKGDEATGGSDLIFKSFEAMKKRGIIFSITQSEWLSLRARASDKWGSSKLHLISP